MLQLAICFSAKLKKYVGTKIVLFLKFVLLLKHKALPGLATNVQARFPYALSHKNGHSAKKNEKFWEEKINSFFKDTRTNNP